MARFHQQLFSPSNYPESTKSVGFKEPHISRVYLTDLYANQKVSFTESQEANHVVTIDTVQPVDYNVQSFLCRALSSQEQLA